MLKNSVFKPSVDTQKWLKAAGIRAAAAMGQVDWKYVLSASALAGVLSMLMSITGIPEVESEE